MADENVTAYHVTGDFRHVIEDGIVDLDALPDSALPTGHVTFTPRSPMPVVAGVPAKAYTLAPYKAMIVAGRIEDLQGRDGVWLAGKVGVQVMRWRAEVHLEFRGMTIPYPDVEFDLSDDVIFTGTILNDLPGEPAIVLDPRIEALAASLEDVDQAVAEAQGYASDAAIQVTLAGQEADRAIGLANAQDEHIAGVLEDPGSATHAALLAVGNATYAPREGSAVYATQAALSSVVVSQTGGATVESVEPVANALAKRTDTGSVQVPNPTGPLDAVPRQWLDGLLSTSAASDGMVLTVVAGAPGWRFPADSYQTSYTPTYP